MLEPKFLLASTSIVLLCFAQTTWASVYKCEADGKKAQYQSTPCLFGKSLVVKVPAPPPAQAKPHVERNTLPSAQDVLDSQRAQERARQFPLENHLSVNLPNTRLSAVLQIIADFAGYALIVDPSITEDGNFNYKNLPASAVLADLANRYGLLVKTDNHTIAVTRK